MKKNKNDLNDIGSSCDWQSPPPRLRKKGDKIYRHKGHFRWTGVKTERYKEKQEGWADIVRNVLVGNNGETCKFHLRYFEINPKGFSSLEKHKHEHVVIGIRGKGKVRLGEKIFDIGYLDTVYVAPNTTHQLINPYDEPFGFFCIVDAKRDKPKIIK
jgi:ribulose-bisphosphate carboxylase large chain